MPATYISSAREEREVEGKKKNDHCSVLCEGKRRNTNENIDDLSMSYI